MTSSRTQVELNLKLEIFSSTRCLTFTPKQQFYRQSSFLPPCPCMLTCDRAWPVPRIAGEPRRPAGDHYQIHKWSTNDQADRWMYKFRHVYVILQLSLRPAFASFEYPAMSIPGDSRSDLRNISSPMFLNDKGPSKKSTASRKLEAQLNKRHIQAIDPNFSSERLPIKRAGIFQRLESENPDSIEVPADKPIKATKTSKAVSADLGLIRAGRVGRHS